MKKGTNSRHDDMRPEYDFSKLQFVGRGVYAEKFRQGHNLIFLEPDVAEVFKDTEAVNKALRSMIQGTTSVTAET